MNFTQTSRYEPCYCSSTEDSVWDDVLKMNDAIGVEYNKLEELFAQKSVTSPTAATLSPDTEDSNKTNTRRNSHKETEVIYVGYVTCFSNGSRTFARFYFTPKTL